jgi:uncharacterized protein
VACRTPRAKRDLRRVVRTPTGDVTFDATGRLAGRGAYVCQDGDCLANAIKKGALTRALEIPLPATFLASAASIADAGPGAIPTLTTEGGARG